MQDLFYLDCLCASTTRCTLVAETGNSHLSSLVAYRLSQARGSFQMDTAFRPSLRGTNPDSDTHAPCVKTLCAFFLHMHLSMVGNGCS